MPYNRRPVPFNWESPPHSFGSTYSMWGSRFSKRISNYHQRRLHTSLTVGDILRRCPACAVHPSYFHKTPTAEFTSLRHFLCFEAQPRFFTPALSTTTEGCYLIPPQRPVAEITAENAMRIIGRRLTIRDLLEKAWEKDTAVEEDMVEDVPGSSGNQTDPHANYSGSVGNLEEEAIEVELQDVGMDVDEDAPRREDVTDVAVDDSYLDPFALEEARIVQRGGFELRDARRGKSRVLQGKRALRKRANVKVATSGKRRKGNGGVAKARVGSNGKAAVRNVPLGNSQPTQQGGSGVSPSGEGSSGSHDSGRSTSEATHTEDGEPEAPLVGDQNMLPPPILPAHVRAECEVEMVFFQHGAEELSAAPDLCGDRSQPCSISMDHPVNSGVWGHKRRPWIVEGRSPFFSTVANSQASKGSRPGSSLSLADTQDFVVLSLPPTTPVSRASSFGSAFTTPRSILRVRSRRSRSEQRSTLRQRSYSASPARPSGRSSANVPLRRSNSALVLIADNRRVSFSSVTSVARRYERRVLLRTIYPVVRVNSAASFKSGTFLPTSDDSSVGGRSPPLSGRGENSPPCASNYRAGTPAPAARAPSEASTVVLSPAPSGQSSGYFSGIDSQSQMGMDSPVPSVTLVNLAHVKQLEGLSGGLAEVTGSVARVDGNSIIQDLVAAGCGTVTPDEACMGFGEPCEGNEEEKLPDMGPATFAACGQPGADGSDQQLQANMSVGPLQDLNAGGLTFLQFLAIRDYDQARDSALRTEPPSVYMKKVVKQFELLKDLQSFTGISDKVAAEVASRGMLSDGTLNGVTSVSLYNAGATIAQIDKAMIKKYS